MFQKRHALKYFMYAIRLFFGGFHRIKIVKLSLIDTKQVLRDPIAAMWYFDQMISGGSLPDLRFVDVKPKKKYYLDFIKALIDFSLGRSNKPKFDPYIIDSFHSLRQHKRQLIFDLTKLSRIDGNIRNLVLYSCEERDTEEDSTREFPDVTNLFRADLLSIFPNVEQVIIQTSGSTSSYSLSMGNLLSIISSSSLNKIIVDSDCAHHGLIQYGTWINTLWQSESAILKKAFAIKGFTISFEHTKRECWWQHFKFIIDRNRAVSGSNALTSGFERISPQNKKFSIGINQNGDEDEETYLDHLHKQLESDGVGAEHIRKFWQFIEAEMVDTEALKLDDTGICSFVGDEKFSQSLRNIMNTYLGVYMFDEL